MARKLPALNIKIFRMLLLFIKLKKIYFFVNVQYICIYTHTYKHTYTYIYIYNIYIHIYIKE